MAGTVLAAAAGRAWRGRQGPWHLACSLLAQPTRSSQASCGPESSGSELAPATAAPRMLQGLLGSDDEEQEDPKDYCKGEAWPGAEMARCRCRG